MLALKYFLMMLGGEMFIAVISLAAYDLWLGVQYQRKLNMGVESTAPGPVRWRMTVALCSLAWGPILMALSFVVVPSGMAGVRISQTRGTETGTLYPGLHFVIPLVERVELFDLRDKLYTTGVVEDGKKAEAGAKPEVLNVQSKEGLSIGLAITVRYRLDANRLDYIQSHLPQPLDSEMVPPIVASAWRELAPKYTVREIFSARREEVRQQAAEIITRKLGTDAVMVKEVMLRDIQLPREYAKGLEQLLLKEQQDDQLNIQTDIQQKQVRIAELEAEAEKVQKVKAAEA
jgi:regulator of protease activity HflC (stomatin/prohibitin superfamily)